MDTPRRPPLTLDEVDGDLRLLTEALTHVQAPQARYDLEVRIDALRALRKAIVREEVEALHRAWMASYPGERAPRWPGQSGVGAS